MSSDLVIGLARESLETMLLVAAPVLGTSLVVGVVVGLFQAVTQLQEMTISFVPKIVATFLALLFAGPWMLGKLALLATAVLENFPAWVR